MMGLASKRHSAVAVALACMACASAPNGWVPRFQSTAHPERGLGSGSRCRADPEITLPMPGRRVLFLCTHNSARSQMAAWRARRWIGP
jgi:hypothetical protein